MDPTPTGKYLVGELGRRLGLMINMRMCAAQHILDRPLGSR